MWSRRLLLPSTRQTVPDRAYSDLKIDKLLILYEAAVAEVGDRLYVLLRIELLPILRAKW